MSSNFPIKNPKANNVFGMYVDEPIGMDHPLFMVRFQSRIDAGFLYQNGTPINDAINSTVKRMRFLFGDDIPDELVKTTVSLTYAENDALKPMQSNGELPISANEDIHNDSGLNRVKIDPLILIPAFMKLVVEKVKIFIARDNKGYVKLQDHSLLDEHPRVRSIWQHPILGLVGLTATCPGSGRAQVKTLTSGELHGVGCNKAGNIFYVARDQLVRCTNKP